MKQERKKEEEKVNLIYIKTQKRNFNYIEQICNKGSSHISNYPILERASTVLLLLLLLCHAQATPPGF